MDPDILRYLEQTKRVLVTDNRNWGIFIVSKHAPSKQVADALFVYWEASEAEGWIDRVEWLVV